MQNFVKLMFLEFSLEFRQCDELDQNISSNRLRYILSNLKALNSFVKLQLAIQIDNFHEFFKTRRHSTVWRNETFSLIQKIFRQINSLVIYVFRKAVTFTKFLPKMRERILVISTPQCHSVEI